MLESCEPPQREGDRPVVYGEYTHTSWCEQLAGPQCIVEMEHAVPPVAMRRGDSVYLVETIRLRPARISLSLWGCIGKGGV